MFFGKKLLRFGENQQITLPSSEAESLASPFFLVQGLDRNLLLLSQRAFDNLYSRIKETSLSDPLARLMSRLFLGGAVELALDKSGKVEIPAELCAYAGLEGEVVLVGQGDFLEIWSSARWQEQMAAMNDHAANASRFEKFDLSIT
jgi:MraZ protein